MRVPEPALQPRAPEPSLPSPIAPPPAPAPQEEPRIEVRIGRIEIKSAAPPPRPPARVPRSPKGFAEHSAARTWRDRKW
ncbi:MAG TPA: hypothetical protein VFR31_05915 [Thermoanaerobaculia bacterium]|nr:hypothetical protein [Thermoanaerobaculia bacterium]